MALSNIIHAVCKRCKKKFKYQRHPMGNIRKYCDDCSAAVKDTFYRGMAERKLPKGQYTDYYKEKHLDWYNAGYVVGTYGDLKRRFNELMAELNDVYLAKKEIEAEQAYLAEIKGLKLDEKCAWWHGFLKEANNVHI